MLSGTEVVDSTETPTANTPTLVEGGDVNVTNHFPVDIIIRVKDENQDVVGEVGVGANSRFNGPHGLTEGTYALCAKEAGAEDFVEIGELDVVPE